MSRCVSNYSVIHSLYVSEKILHNFLMNLLERIDCRRGQWIHPDTNPSRIWISYFVLWMLGGKN